MEKLRYNEETGKFTPVPLHAPEYCSINQQDVEKNLDRMAEEIIPLLNPSPQGGDWEIWIPLATYGHTGCKIPESVITRALRQIAIIFGGANVVKSVDGLWLNQEAGASYLYSEANHNITIELQGMDNLEINKITKILAETLGSIYQQLSVLIVARPVYSTFHNIEKSKTEMEEKRLDSN
ncbi:MAG: hypothetical protein QXL94_00300 [Candidatus Parvarchaeum sp.]